MNNKVTCPLISPMSRILPYLDNIPRIPNVFLFGNVKPNSSVKDHFTFFSRGKVRVKFSITKGTRIITIIHCCQMILSKDFLKLWILYQI